jgi:hypothetical protein
MWYHQFCFIPCDTCKLFYTKWCIQNVLFHVISLIRFISCDTFKLFYTMWYLQTVVCHVIHSNCCIPCDTCEKKLLVIIILLWGYSQSQFLSLSGTTITVPRYFAMWCIQTVSYHVISSNCSYHVIPSTNFFIPCDTSNLFYTMWCIQTVWYHVLPLICFISCDTFKLFIPYDTFNLCYAMWYLQPVVYHLTLQYL